MNEQHRDAPSPAYISLGTAYPEGAPAPLVSVIIPVYNVEKYLRECLDSVIGQSLRELEIICIDDGSADGSLEILKEYQNRDGRISVISKRNEGLSVSRNIGIGYARGKYLQFLDSDDYLTSDALEILVEISERKGLEALFYDYERIVDDGAGGISRSFTPKRKEYADIYDGVSFLKILKDNSAYVASACHTLILRDFLMCSKLSFYRGILHEDELFCFMLMMKAERVSHIGRAFYQRRIRSNSIMTTPKSHKNVIGYFITMQEILRYGLAIENDPRRMEEAWRAYREFNWQSKHIYSLIDQEDRSRIALDNPFSQMLFKTLVASSGGVDIKEGHDDLSSMSVEELRESALYYRNAAAHCQEEIDGLRSSVSYKLGRFLTWLPRKTKGLLNCFRENGLRYTLNHFLVKLGLKNK